MSNLKFTQIRNRKQNWKFQWSNLIWFRHTFLLLCCTYVQYVLCVLLQMNSSTIKVRNATDRIRNIVCLKSKLKFINYIALSRWRDPWTGMKWPPLFSRCFSFKGGLSWATFGRSQTLAFGRRIWGAQHYNELVASRRFLGSFSHLWKRFRNSAPRVAHFRSEQSRFFAFQMETLQLERRRLR